MKKILLLVSLLLLLGGIVLAQTFQSTPMVQAVPADVTQQAETTLRAFLEAAHARNTRQLLALSAFETKDAAQTAMALAIGDSRSGTFEFQGIDFEGNNSDRMALIGFFPSGRFLRATVSKTGDSYRVISITEP